MSLNPRKTNNLTNKHKHIYTKKTQQTKPNNHTLDDATVYRVWLRWS